LSRKGFLLISLICILCLNVPSVKTNSNADRVLKVDLDVEITFATTRMMEDVVSYAEQIGAGLILVTADTPGGEVNAVKEIMNIFESSSIPVCFYVYPVGASAWSGGTYLLASSHIAAMASGTSIGSAQPISSMGEPINDTKRINALSALIVNHAEVHGRNVTAMKLFVQRNLNLGPREALRFGVVEIVADSIPGLLGKLSDKTLLRTVSEEGVSLWRLVPSREASAYDAVESYNFSGLEEGEVVEYIPGPQMWLLRIFFHPLASGLIFFLGFYLLLFGLQAPGLGAEFVGGLMVLLSLMAFQIIGIDLTIMILFGVGFALLLAEIETNIGFLGIAGAICIILASFLLFPSPQWLLTPETTRGLRMVLVSSSILLTILFGVLTYKVVQAKRQSVRTGYEALEGSVGTTKTSLDPDGEVRVAGEIWRARSEEGRIPEGQRVRVTGKEGLTLLVRGMEEPTDIELQEEKE